MAGKRWRGRAKSVNVADLITATSGLVGMLAIMYFIDGSYIAGSTAILIAVLLDGLDGIVARKYKSESQRGAYMDVVSDTIAFGLAPAIMVYSRFYDLWEGSAWVSQSNMVVMLVCSGLVVSGVYRLGRNVKGQFETGYFDGLPCPASALMIIGVFMVFGTFMSVVSTGVIVSLLMISRIPYPQLRGASGLLGGLVLVLMVLFVSSPYFIVPWGVFMVMYVLGGPAYWWRSKE